MKKPPATHSRRSKTAKVHEKPVPERIKADVMPPADFLLSDPGPNEKEDPTEPAGRHASFFIVFYSAMSNGKSN
jgi:hypothetical protein